METVLQDVRYALRMLRKNLGFAAVAICTLALGIGANTAIFTVVKAVLLQPLPYRNYRRAVMVWGQNRNTGSNRDFATLDSFDALRTRGHSFEQMASLSPTWSLVISSDGEPERLPTYFVSASFPAVLGVTPEKGRFFLPQEDVKGSELCVVISHRLWQERLHADPNVLGRFITLDLGRAKVVGVMPASFRFLDDVDAWVPLAANPIYQRPDAKGVVRFLTVVGLMKPGVGIEQAQQETRAIAGQLETERPATNRGWSVNLVPMRDEVAGKVRPALLVLLGAVALVLLIACANVANLLLTRAAARRKEIAVRQAIGARWGRMLRQFLTESLVLAGLGGAAGLLLATWGLGLLRGLVPPTVSAAGAVGIDNQVLVFTAAVAVITGVLFGLAPTLGLGKSDLCDALKDAGRTTAGSVKAWLRSALVVAEMALALMLLAGAGLLMRSFVELMQVDPGFRPDHLLTLQVMLPQQDKYNDAAQRTAVYQQIFQRLEALPGVHSAGGTTRLPLREGASTRLEIEGRPLAEGERPEVEFRRASTDYFRAMGIATLQGRVFNSADRADSLPAAVINQAAAQRIWPGENPVGKRVRWSSTWLTIVGVVGNVKQFGLDAPAPPEIYTHFDQGPPYNPLLVIRTAADPAAIAAAARAQLRAAEPGLVIYRVETMESLVSASVAERRLNMWLMGAFAALAAVLAGIGIYGLMSYTVAQRTHEIGIRMALGAGREDVFRLVLGNAGRLAALGLVIGLGGALALSRLLRSVLFGVRSTDPLTFVGVALILAVVALLASYIPARRATRVDPMVALRYE